MVVLKIVCCRVVLVVWGIFFFLCIFDRGGLCFFKMLGGFCFFSNDKN